MAQTLASASPSVSTFSRGAQLSLTGTQCCRSREPLVLSLPASRWPRCLSNLYFPELTKRSRWFSCWPIGVSGTCWLEAHWWLCTARSFLQTVIALSNNSGNWNPLLSWQMFRQIIFLLHSSREVAMAVGFYLACGVSCRGETNQMQLEIFFEECRLQFQGIALHNHFHLSRSL